MQWYISIVIPLTVDLSPDMEKVLRWLLAVHCRRAQRKWPASQKLCRYIRSLNRSAYMEKIYMPNEWSEVPFSKLLHFKEHLLEGAGRRYTLTCGLFQDPNLIPSFNLQWSQVDPSHGLVGKHFFKRDLNIWQIIGYNNFEIQFTLQGTNISHLGKRKIIFKYALSGGYVNSLEGRSMLSGHKVFWA